MARSRGKHTKRIHPRFSKILMFLILFTMVGQTTAYMMSKSSIKNEFEIGVVRPEVIENFDSKNKIKEDVYIHNSGNVPIYVRTAIVVKWKDKYGKILDTLPQKNIDYTISFSSSENWIKSQDEYYYYRKSVNANENTDILIEECTQIKEYNDRILEVSIITQGIQAEPPDAAEEAWDINIVNNLINI